MTTSAIERDKKIVEVLEKTMKLYRKAIEMDWESQQRLIMDYFILLAETKPEIACVKEACQTILTKYPEGIPHDSDLFTETKELLPHLYNKSFQ